MGTFEGPRRAGKARAWNKGGIEVLNLRGSLAEMAGQHGALLREQIHKGALPYLGRRNRELLARSHVFRERPRLLKLALDAMGWCLHRPMLAQMPRHYFDEVRELARASGLEAELCMQSVLQPDTLVLLLRYFMGRHVLGEMAGGFPGCTSIVALKEATLNKTVLHARNMDYPVVGRWDAYPALLYFDPEGPDRSAGRFVSVTSAGVHTAGVTSVNEWGLALSTHFHCSKAVSPFGTPVQIIGTELIRRARTLGQAIDVARGHMRAGSWSFVVSSARENAAAVLEMTHDKLVIREPERGKLVHTNHFHAPELQRLEILLSASVADDYSSRYRRADQLFEDHRGEIEAKTLAQTLADHFDLQTGRVRSHGNTLSVVTTVTSMITELSEGRFWVGASKQSPTCLGDYLGFRVDETFDAYDHAEPPTLSWSPQRAATIRGTAKLEAFRRFREAYIAHHIEFANERAAEEAEHAARLDPEEGHFHLAHGFLCSRLGRFDRALDAFERALACALSPHMRQVAVLFRAHAEDCLERRESALVAYRALARDAIDPHLRAEAKRCLKKPFRPERVSRITFDLQFCDSLEYA